MANSEVNNLTIENNQAAQRWEARFGQHLNETWVSPHSFFGGWNGTMSMPLDLYESDEAYVVTAFMPGVPSDKLDIQVQQNILSIHGEVSIEQPRDVRYLIQERGSSVLTITLPKSESVKPHHISVKTA
jgi:HSP20 family protein